MVTSCRRRCTGRAEAPGDRVALMHWQIGGVVMELQREHKYPPLCSCAVHRILQHLCIKALHLCNFNGLCHRCPVAVQKRVRFRSLSAAHGASIPAACDANDQVPSRRATCSAEPCRQVCHLQSSRWPATGHNRDMEAVPRTRLGRPIERDQPAAAQSSEEPEEGNSAFECNICYELAHEPVVTLCGHLYCWPCIYRCANAY